MDAPVSSVAAFTTACTALAMSSSAATTEPMPFSISSVRASSARRLAVSWRSAFRRRLLLTRASSSRAENGLVR
ncbi:hypothetical protein D3C72_1289580 [compost metagenome]